MELSLKISLDSDIGCIRTNNEDMILISGETYRDCHDAFSTVVQTQGRFVAAVADGMGGHNAGEVASELALNYFDNFIVNLQSGLSDKDFRYKLDEAIKRIHRNINEYGLTHPGCAGLGTTLVALLTYENRIYAINVGDSRIYRSRNGMLYRLTTDHSEQYRNNDSTIPSNLIYNCLGGGGESAFADVKELSSKVFENDAYLLCSDGLSDMLCDDDIEYSLNASGDVSALVALAKSKGGIDNISAIIVRIEKIN